MAETATGLIIVVVDASSEPWPEPETLLAHGVSEQVVREYRLLLDYFQYVLPRAVMESRN